MPVSPVLLIGLSHSVVGFGFQFGAGVKLKRNSLGYGDRVTVTGLR
jgi:hypothetical protein